MESSAMRFSGLQVPLKDVLRPAGIQRGLNEDEDAQLGQMAMTEKWLEATHNQPRLLIAFSIILCGYGESPSPDEALDVFDEKDAPLNLWDRTLCYESALHLVASLCYTLDVDAHCIVHALVLLERLGRKTLHALLVRDKWRYTVVVVFAIAAKMWYDESTWLCDVELALKQFGYCASQLHRKELRFLALVDHHTFVSTDAFEGYLAPMLEVAESDQARALLQRIQEMAAVEDRFSLD